MNKITKTILLSGLVFPGAGHLYLKARLTGFSLLGVSLLCLIYIVNTVMQQANAIVDKILANQLPPDITTITAFVQKELAGLDTQSQNMAMLVLVACWFIGLFDSYRIAKKIKQAEDLQARVRKFYE